MIRKKVDYKPIKEDEKKVVDGLLDGKNMVEASTDVFGYEKNEKALARARTRSILRRDRVIRYLENSGLKAAKKIVMLGQNAKNETVQLNANKDILDRAGIGIQKGTTTAIQINVEELRERYRVE